MYHIKKIKPNKNIWIILGSIALILRGLLSAEQIEHWYSRGLFLWLRQVIDFIAAWIPFPMVYALAVALLYKLIQAIRKPSSAASIQQKIIRILHNWLAFAMAVIFFFLFLWGYNYGRIPIEHQMGFETKPLSFLDLKMELDSTTKVIDSLRMRIPHASDSALTAAFIPRKLESSMRGHLAQILKEIGYPASNNPRGRLLYPKGLLLRISTAGVYIPFTGEGHIDAGLHPIQMPFVMAHELSHAYGFGDEGTCNFTAFLACINSGDPVLEYIGYFSYWRYVASNYRRYDREGYAEFYDKKVPLGVKNDLRAIYETMDQYPDILPNVRDAVYNNYLKAQGIQEGIQNYSRILMLEKGRKSQFQ